MIIPNGTIQVKRKTAGGIDPATGYPVASTAEWGEPVPCQWAANKFDRLGRVRGEHFTVASFSVLIEWRPLGGVEQVRLRDLSGRELGEFSIMSVEPLEAVGQLRIMV